MRVTRTYEIHLTAEEAEHLDTALYVTIVSNASDQVSALAKKLRELLDTDGS